MKLQTPKGFRDFLPAEAIKRQFVLGKITETFAKFGFDPLETPTLEFAETLKGKYGEEEKLIYQFTTPGGDEVAMRYDQTVPLCRVIAQYGPNGQQTLAMPFKRYQIQSAFRGENTQKGRYREFLQCDADIVGGSTTLVDAELLGLIYEIYQKLGLKVTIKFNDRNLFTGIETKYLAAIDKLDKIGPDGVLKELESRGLSDKEATVLFEKVTNFQPTPQLNQTIEVYQNMGYPADSLKFDGTLVRGLDYYTGLIIEVVLKSQPTSSALAGGGRYDNLISKFSGTDLPANGFSIGIDRTIEAMEEAGLLKDLATNSQVLVTIFSEELTKKSVLLATKLRQDEIKTELWLDSSVKLEKQLKYADQKGIRYVAIIGPDEAKSNTVTLKDLNQKTQQTIEVNRLPGLLKEA